MPIPKLKDYVCKSLTYDDFRGIAISPIILKVFEHCFLNKFQPLLASSEKQFVKVIDSYTNNGTTANICSIDLSKLLTKLTIMHYSLNL